MVRIESILHRQKSFVYHKLLDSLISILIEKMDAVNDSSMAVCLRLALFDDELRTDSRTGEIENIFHNKLESRQHYSMDQKLDVMSEVLLTQILTGSAMNILDEIMRYIVSYTQSNWRVVRTSILCKLSFTLYLALREEDLKTGLAQSVSQILQNAIKERIRDAEISRGLLTDEELKLLQIAEIILSKFENLSADPSNEIASIIPSEVQYSIPEPTSESRGLESIYLFCLIRECSSYFPNPQVIERTMRQFIPFVNTWMDYFQQRLFEGKFTATQLHQTTLTLACAHSLGLNEILCLFPLQYKDLLASWPEDTIENITVDLKHIGLSTFESKAIITFLTSLDPVPACIYEQILISWELLKQYKDLRYARIAYFAIHNACETLLKFILKSYLGMKSKHIDGMNYVHILQKVESAKKTIILPGKRNMHKMGFNSKFFQDLESHRQKRNTLQHQGAGLHVDPRLAEDYLIKVRMLADVIFNCDSENLIQT